MLGTRLPDGTTGISEMLVGCYYKDNNNEWRGVTPNGLHVWLKNHKCVEELDGTVTVTPSILARNGTGNIKWHGYLTRGEWKEC